VEVKLPATLAADMGAGWSEAVQDTFGEFQLGVWLREAGVSASDASAAAAGWGGDRLGVLEGPGDAWAVVMSTAWDSTTDATEFETAAGASLSELGGSATILPGKGGDTRWLLVASDDDTLARVASVLGLAG
jgi:hypothetical protein